MKKVLLAVLFLLFPITAKAEVFSFELKITKDGKPVDICNDTSFKNKIKIKSSLNVFTTNTPYDYAKESDYNCMNGFEGYYFFNVENHSDDYSVSWYESADDIIDIEILDFPNDICELEKSSFKVVRNDYDNEMVPCQNQAEATSDSFSKYKVKRLNDSDCAEFNEFSHTYTLNCVSKAPSAAKVKINVLSSTNKTPFVGITYNVFASSTVTINNKVYNAGEVVATLTSNEEGHSLSNELPLGSYYLMQASETPGYVKDTNKYTLELTKNGEVVNVDIYLDPLPQTGIQDYYLPIGISLMAFALIVNGTIFFKERKRAKNQID